MFEAAKEKGGEPFGRTFPKRASSERPLSAHPTCTSHATQSSPCDSLLSTPLQ